MNIWNLTNGEFCTITTLAMFLAGAVTVFRVRVACRGVDLVGSEAAATFPSCMLAFLICLTFVQWTQPRVPFGIVGWTLDVVFLVFFGLATLVIWVSPRECFLPPERKEPQP